MTDALYVEAHKRRNTALEKCKKVYERYGLEW
jgi:RecA-family ATPase